MKLKHIIENYGSDLSLLVYNYYYTKIFKSFI